MHVRVLLSGRHRVPRRLWMHNQLDEGVEKFVYKLLELASSKKDAMDGQTKQYWKNTLELLRGMDIAETNPGLRGLASALA